MRRFEKSKRLKGHGSYYSWYVSKYATMQYSQTGVEEVYGKTVYLCAILLAGG